MKFKLRKTILDLLMRIDEDSGFSHLIIDHEINRRNIEPKDQALLTEVVYGTMERKMTLDFFLEPFIKNKKIDSWVRMLLRMSVYQMIYLDKVPTYAIIHEAVEIAKRRGHRGIGSFVNGVLRNVERKGVRDTKEIKDKVKRLAIETSHPEWLVKRWIKHYGFQLTKEMCEANLERKPIAVRVQPLKISREKAIEQLTEQGFQVSPSTFSKQGIIIKQGNILTSDLFVNGMITIQDQSSMLVAEMLDVKSDMKVLDTCSAPGGKATHIAEKMENKGLVCAYDFHSKKINLVNKQAERLHLSIIEAKQGDARDLQNAHESESFDRILVDAPCSGLGVVRSKPDIKYNKQTEDITRLANIQFDILNSVASLLKKEGLLIYSTCTVDVEENETVVRKFLEKNSDYKVDEKFFKTLPTVFKQYVGLTEYGLQIFPQTFQTDGFFLTRLKKN